MGGWAVKQYNGCLLLQVALIIYIYIERERERERPEEIYIYIYIYIKRKKKKGLLMWSGALLGLAVQFTLHLRCIRDSQ